MGAFATPKPPTDIVPYVGGGDSHVWFLYKNHTSSELSWDQMAELKRYLGKQAIETDKMIRIINIFANVFLEQGMG